MEFPIIKYLLRKSGLQSAFIFFLILFFPETAQLQEILPYKNPTLTIETRVQDLLSRMTPEEKFWQLFMIPGDLDSGKEKFKNGIFGLQISAKGNSDAAGQILDYSTYLPAHSMAKKVNSIQRYFVEETRLGIPIFAFEEALHGLIGEGATAFPQAIGLAASFDTDLMSRVATTIAHETKSRGIRMVLSPVVNIANDVRWGRTEETYGEDPFLTSAMGVAFVSAFEDKGIVTTPKHFVANTGDGGRDSYPIAMSERHLEEIHFPPFWESITKGGARSIMTSYNSLDGSPCTASSWLLNTKLKQQQNFKGFVISDASAVGGANVLHYTAADYSDASAKAINNGLDVIFQTDFDHHKLFIPPFLDGRIPMQTIDEAVAQVLRIKFELGLFENPYADESEVDRWNNIPEHKQLAREAAQRSIVLLKNENRTLPLSKSTKSIAIIGSDAVEGRLGGYSGQGNGVVSILDGIKGKLDSKTRVDYAAGCGRDVVEWVTIPSENLFTTVDGKKVNGLLGEYFNNVTLSGQPELTRIDPEINFRWTLYSPDSKINFDFFSARWTGKLKSPATGRFKIGIDGNDGSRLYINEKLLIDNWKKQSYSTKLADYQFEKGKEYDIKVEFFESSGSVWFNMIWDIGVEKNATNQIKEAIAIAKKTEQIIVVAGIEEGEGRDRAHLGLPGRQEEMIAKLSQLGKPITVILVGGSAITKNNWIDKVDAVLHVWYPGEEGGNAVADILFGDYNPAGRLPITFPITEGQLPLVYNHKPTGRNDDYGDQSGKPLFPFGFGLSYTQFEYSNLKIDKKEFAASDSCSISFTLKNIGDRAGDEVVQLYINDMLASVARPLKELKGFQRVHLTPGEEILVKFTIGPKHLKMLNQNMEWVVEPGDFRIMIGASAMDIRLREIISVK
ncbi:MAG: glycoside hydrolase family 3 N-terminal domain-containing protein [Tenuifilaceae bacterium]|jgi:beta-glucosidase|nr:glycoside hydrolase family 3 N-terminal domain-containing protein [Tenuifilaceae bacterium]